MGGLEIFQKKVAGGGGVGGGLYKKGLYKKQIGVVTLKKTMPKQTHTGHTGVNRLIQI